MTKGPRWGFAHLLLLVAAGGCGAATAGDSIPVPAPELPAGDGLLGDPDLQAIVDLQVRRDGPGLRGWLESPEPRLRARAALALASVQDPTSLGALTMRLGDPSPEVRRNAAFAIGQLSLEDGGENLLASLAEETNPTVRASLIEALGKRGGLEAIASLLEVGSPDDEPGRTLSISRAALREVRPPGALEFLAARLADPDPRVRTSSAYYFGRASDVTAWAEFAPTIRAALDQSFPDAEAPMHLVQALGRLGEVPEDAGRIAHWMRFATDWRTRANAASIVMSPRWLESPEIQAALEAALLDESEHVRVAAAGSIALLTWSSERHLALAEEWIEGAPEDWRAQAPFGPPLAAQGRGEVVVAWTRRLAGAHPAGAARGIEMLGGVQGPEVIELLFQVAEHPDPLPRAAALRALMQRWERGVVEGEPVDRFYAVFAAHLGDDENLPAARAAAALSHPDFAALGGEALLEEAFRVRRPGGDPNVLVPILESMGSSSLPLLREVAEEETLALRGAAARALERLTGEQVPIGGTPDEVPEPSIDWGTLAALGATPRVRIATEQGEIVVRLYVEQAPLTVQTFVSQVRAGLHDGTRFHRVVANFVAQAGDFGMGDGTGTVGYQIKSEFTQLPFQRGVLGMASAGKDTEGSQYYLTHSMQPHLNGSYTAFGWIESGAPVLDRIQQGDRVVRMTVEE